MRMRFFFVCLNNKTACLVQAVLCFPIEIGKNFIAVLVAFA